MVSEGGNFRVFISRLFSGILFLAKVRLRKGGVSEENSSANDIRRGRGFVAVRSGFRLLRQCGDAGSRRRDQS